MDCPSSLLPLASVSAVCSRTPEDHILNMSTRVSHHNQNPSSEELVKEIAVLEDEILNLESYILSLYRAALQRHLPDILGNYGDSVKEIIRVSPGHKSDHLSEKTRLDIPGNCYDQKGQSFRKSALAGPKDLVQVALPKSSSGRVGEKKGIYSRRRSLANYLGNYRMNDSHICPCGLSEDIIRCISLIYCKLAKSTRSRKAYSVSSASSLCSSSTFSPRNLSGSWSPLYNEVSEHSDFEGLKHDKGPCSAMVEVQEICLDDENYSYAATMLEKFRSLVKCLENVNPKKMKREVKLAFWINIHNALVMHAYLAYGPQNNIKSAFVEKATYNVGGHHINAYDIQSNILGIKSHYSAPWWLQTLLSPGKRFSTGTAKHAYAIEYPEPLVHFALCSGAYSDPAVRIYSAKHLFQDLKVAKKEFIQATVYVHKETKIYLPKILRCYAKDMSLGMAALLEVVSGYLPESLQKAIQKIAKGRPEKHVYWLEQSSSFRYLIDNKIAEMRWDA